MVVCCIGPLEIWPLVRSLNQFSDLTKGFFGNCCVGKDDFLVDHRFSLGKKIKIKSNQTLEKCLASPS